ncbi:MAG: hypothetical protein U0796_20915 [Gemmatales bacterium]
MSHTTLSTATSATLSRERPALFRALGKSQPPECIEVDGQTYLLKELFKHDSWAATALYEGESGLVIAKFNRQQRIGFIPMGWLGRWLARHEAALLANLQELPNIPRLLGNVMVDGKVARHAVARGYILGHPMRSKEILPESFFQKLHDILDDVHACNIAYMDLHKRENIIVGDDGEPYLIDFQVSYILPRGWWTRLTPLPWILRLLQQSDRYHCIKHFVKHSDAGAAQGKKQVQAARPWWIKVHRFFAVPFRETRRRFLVLLGIRKGKGRVETEVFTEDGLREPAKAA